MEPLNIFRNRFRDAVFGNDFESFLSGGPVTSFDLELLQSSLVKEVVFVLDGARLIKDRVAIANGIDEVCCHYNWVFGSGMDWMANAAAASYRDSFFAGQKWILFSNINYVAGPFQNVEIQKLKPAQEVVNSLGFPALDSGREPERGNILNVDPGFILFKPAQTSAFLNFSSNSYFGRKSFAFCHLCPRF